MKGKLILILAPSGSGKGTLMSALRERMPELLYPVSCTTRAKRPGEEDGKVYHFLTNEEFDRKIVNSEFLEWATYGGNRYGTLRADVLVPLEQGKMVVDELEAQGVRTLQRILPPEALRIIYIDAGSWEDLEARILARANISSEELAKRREHFEDERQFMPQAFRVVQNPNGGLEQAKVDFICAVQDAIAS